MCFIKLQALLMSVKTMSVRKDYIGSIRRCCEISGNFYIANWWLQLVLTIWKMTELDACWSGPQAHACLCVRSGLWYVEVLRGGFTMKKDFGTSVQKVKFCLLTINGWIKSINLETIFFNSF